MSQTIKCPECNTKLLGEFVRCPHCFAFVVDSSPWKRDYNVFTIPAAILIWWVADQVLSMPGSPASAALADPISKTILGLTIYGLLVLLMKFVITARQNRAFRIVREACAAEEGLGPQTLTLARERIRQAGIGPYNSFIAYHRLQWLLSASKADRDIQVGLLEAQGQHADTDWDSLDSSFSSAQYLIWLLPTAGFLGTVYGMTNALSSFSEVLNRPGSDTGFQAGLQMTTQNLGVAFYTTLVGLACVIPVLAAATVVRRRAQTFLERSDKYFIRLAAITLHAESKSTPVAAAAPNLSKTALPELANVYGAPDRTVDQSAEQAMPVAKKGQDPDQTLGDSAGETMMAEAVQTMVAEADQTLVAEASKTMFADDDFKMFASAGKSAPARTPRPMVGDVSQPGGPGAATMPADAGETLLAESIQTILASDSKPQASQPTEDAAADAEDSEGTFIFEALETAPQRPADARLTPAKPESATPPGAKPAAPAPDAEETGNAPPTSPTQR